MKQFIVLCVFTFSLTSVFGDSNLFDLELGTSFKPGKCPEATRLAQPFDLKQFLGTWFEVKSTQPIFEKGQRCVQANYKLDTESGKVVVTNSGVNNEGKTVSSIGSASTTDQDNVFGVKFFPLQPSAQYWIVDTDYKEYALVVSCNNILSLFNFSDVWILSRQPKLDAEIIKTLEAKLESVGITGTKLSDSVQNC